MRDGGLAAFPDVTWHHLRTFARRLQSHYVARLQRHSRPHMVDARREAGPKCHDQTIGRHAGHCRHPDRASEHIVLFAQSDRRGNAGSGSGAIIMAGWGYLKSDVLSSLGKVALAVTGSLALTGCWVVTLPKVHYRLTVVVDTPEGRRSGSSVVEFRSDYTPDFPFPATASVTYNLRGEATPIRLPNGKYLFAVLKWTEADAAKPMLLESFADILPPRLHPVHDDADNRQVMAQIKALSKLRASRPVKPKYYPVFAWFDDIARPRTIHALPAHVGDVIMTGVKLSGMTLEITDLPVTHQVKRILSWLHRKDLGYLDPKIKTTGYFPEYRLLGSDDFVLGE